MRSKLAVSLRLASKFWNAMKILSPRERRHPGAPERVVRLADILRATSLDRLIHDDVAVERLVLLLGERQGHVHEEREEDGSKKAYLHVQDVHVFERCQQQLQQHDMRRETLRPNRRVPVMKVFAFNCT